MKLLFPSLWEILFSSGNDKHICTPGTGHRFFLACDEELRRPQAEDTSGSLFNTWPKPETAHEKPLAPRVKHMLMSQKNVNTDSPIVYFRVPHNTLCCTPHFACYCPQMILGKCSTPRSIWKQWFMQNLGANRVYYGGFENSQWSQVLTIMCLYFRSNYTEMRRLERELYEVNLLRKQAIDDQE